MPCTQAQIRLMQVVLDDLSHGCDSKVGPLGDKSTYCRNKFADPAMDIPRNADALVQGVKMGHMVGPLLPGQIPDAKVNGFLPVVKGGGARRQVGNMSAPKGFSFNDGSVPLTLNQWKVFQTSSNQLSHMLARAGRLHYVL